MILHSFVSSKYFDLANAGVIGLNVIMMALEYYLMPWVSTVVTHSVESLYHQHKPRLYSCVQCGS